MTTMVVLILFCNICLSLIMPSDGDEAHYPTQEDNKRDVQPHDLLRVRAFDLTAFAVNRSMLKPMQRLLELGNR